MSKSCMLVRSTEIAVSVRHPGLTAYAYISGWRQCLPHATHAVPLLRAASGDAIAASPSSIELAPSQIDLASDPQRGRAAPRAIELAMVSEGNGMTLQTCHPLPSLVDVRARRAYPHRSGGHSRPAHGRGLAGPCLWHGEARAHSRIARPAVVSFDLEASGVDFASFVWWRRMHT